MNKEKFIGGVYYFSGINRRREEKYFDYENDKNNLLCRFVLDGLGVKIGESIALNDDILIIKNGKKYLGIPLKHVEEDGDELIVKGLVDKKKALDMGEKWCKFSFNNIEYNQEEK